MSKNGATSTGRMKARSFECFLAVAFVLSLAAGHDRGGLPRPSGRAVPSPVSSAAEAATPGCRLGGAGIGGRAPARGPAPPSGTTPPHPPPLSPPPPSPAGKVHGSLARAGKVRGQTPKVAKQEKAHGKAKNDLRGRAKKRMQYNKRYVNVVVGMGGKKVGPNSQAERMAKAEAAKLAAGQTVKA